MGEAAFNGAEADDDVVAGAQGLGRLAGVLVGEGVDAHVWVVAFDVLGHGIDEAQERGGGAAFLVVQGLALLALAPVAGVVLGNADDARLGMVRNPLADAGLGELKHAGIRETALDVAALALALDEREVLGMLLEKVRRNQAVEAVNEREIDGETPAVFVGELVMVAIEPVAGRKIGVVEHFGPEHLAVFERGHLGLVE